MSKAGLFVELSHECVCGAWSESRASLVFVSLGPERMSGTWMVHEVSLPPGWRLNDNRMPVCPICSGEE